MLTAKREDLLAACSLAHAAVSNRPLMPTYHDLHLRTDAGPNIYVTGSDTDTTVQARVTPAETTGEQAVCLNAILSACRGEFVRIEVRKTTAVVTCEDPVTSSRHEMTTQPASAYAMAIPATWKHHLVFDRTKLMSSLRDTLVACAKKKVKEEDLPGMQGRVLMGVFFSHADGVLIGSDAKRVAVMPCRPEDTVQEVGPVFSNAIFYKDAAMVVDLLRQSTGEYVNVACDESSMTFGCGNAVLQCRTQAGRYPDKAILGLFPKAFRTTVTWRVADLLSGVRLAEINADDASGRINLSVDANMDSVLSAVDAGKGRTGSVKVRTAGGSGEAVRVDFDAKYARQFLDTLDADEIVTVQFNGPDRPFIFGHPSGGKYAVVPMAQTKAAPAPEPMPKSKRGAVPAWEAAG